MEIPTGGIKGAGRRFKSLHTLNIPEQSFKINKGAAIVTAPVKK